MKMEYWIDLLMEWEVTFLLFIKLIGEFLIR